MPSAVHERDIHAGVARPVTLKRRPRQVLAFAWCEAVLRKALRIYNHRTVATKRSFQKSLVDPYSTFPVRLSPAETARLEEILNRHRASS